MNTNELINKLFYLDKDLNDVSNTLPKNIEFDKTDEQYINNKIENIINTAKYIQGQLKYIKFLNNEKDNNRT
jgi:hypothetical protein